MHFRVLAGFDELPQATWTRLLKDSPTAVVFLTRGWLQTWWDTLGQGTLLLVVAEHNDREIALAPLYASENVVSFLGTDSADYLDFLGDLSDPATLEGLLSAAADATRSATFRLAAIPQQSPTGGRLASAAARLRLVVHGEEPVPAPALSSGDLIKAAHKKSLRRHENWFRRRGMLSVTHASHGEAIEAHLDRFFAQHVERCTLAPYPSLFEDPGHRAFYRQLTRQTHDSGWLRFTRIDWDDTPIAYHFGMSFKGSFLWYKPSFEISLAHASPGEVLLRALLLAAHDEHAHTFDFGLGGEAFKYRFATSTPHVRTWTLAPC